MTPLTREWVMKADGDYATASRELRARKQPNYDAACFHAQQCAEKDLKTVDALVRKLQTMIPELLAANGCAEMDEVSFKLLSECTAVTHRHAA